MIVASRTSSAVRLSRSAAAALSSLRSVTNGEAPPLFSPRQERSITASIPNYLTHSRGGFKDLGLFSAKSFARSYSASGQVRTFKPKIRMLSIFYLILLSIVV